MSAQVSLPVIKSSFGARYTHCGYTEAKCRVIETAPADAFGVVYVCVELEEAAGGYPKGHRMRVSSNRVVSE
jgi:hypothetical protein